MALAFNLNVNKDIRIKKNEHGVKAEKCHRTTNFCLYYTFGISKFFFTSYSHVCIYFMH